MTFIVGHAEGFVEIGALIRVITGAVMVWLLRQPDTEEPSPP